MSAGENKLEVLPLGPTIPGIRPRDAATLVIVRHDGKKPRVLMGRRHRGHDFLPGLWVFPGGRIHPSDFRAPYSADLTPETLRRATVGIPEHRARALAMTAIRETFEETGLLLARAAPVRPGAGPWREFLAQGALPDLSSLRYIARAVTPPVMHKRYDARFFMASAESLLSLQPCADCGELDEIAWVDFDEAAELQLPTITRFLIRELELLEENPDRPALYLRHRRGRSLVSAI